MFIIPDLIHKTIYLVHFPFKLSPYLTNWSVRLEDVWGSGCIDPYFLNFGTGWWWVVSFTLLPLYSRGKSSRYPLDRRLVGRSGRYEEVGILDPTGTPTPPFWSTSP
jgi:hypothetical protein